MASCQTSQWGSSSPYVKLTVTENTSSSTATKAVLSWTLQYIASYAASTSVAKAFTVKIAGETVGEGTYNINGKTGTHTIDSGTLDVTKGTSSKSVAFSVSFAFNLTWSDIYKGTLSASSSISVAAKTSYTIKFDANGGSGAPSSQSKWHGTNITLSSTKPTRTGYTFKGWGTSATTTTVSYAAGATYSANANATLYAIWTANTYAVTYNANGGSGAPSSQTKTHGVSLTLSSTKPTRTNYTFSGWGTSASSTTVAYAAGASYTKNSAITLYAIWTKSYTKPKITSFSVTRCDSAGTASETGTYARVKFNWSTSKTIAALYVEYQAPGETSWSRPTVTASGTSGSVDKVVGDNKISTENNYTFRITISDAGGVTITTKTLPSIALPIDFKADGTGTAIGKTAEHSNLFDVGWISRFREDIMLGQKTGYEDGNQGVYIDSEGFIHLQRSTEQGYHPYIAFYLGTAITPNGRIQLNSADKFMKFLDASGYQFDNAIHLATSSKIGTILLDTDGYMNFKSAARYTFDKPIVTTDNIWAGDELVFGADDQTGTVTHALQCWWQDSSKHNIVGRDKDGLTATFGWSGSNSYATVAQLAGRTCKYVNASGATVLSDERLKKDFADLSGWEAFFDALEPYAFKMKGGTSGRYHLGFKAQQVEKALLDSGLSTKDFAGFVKMKYTLNEDDPEGAKVYEEAGIEPGDDEYGLIYSEFTALNTYMVQKLQKENAELSKKVEDLETRLAKLEALLNVETV